MAISSGSAAGVGPNVSTVLATTTSRLIEKFPITMRGAQHKILKYLQDSAVPYNGGRILEVPILHGRGQGITYIGGDSTFAALPAKGLGSTMWNWHLGLGTVTYTLQDILQNQGSDVQIANLRATKVQQMKADVEDGWNSDLVTGNASSARKFTGVNQIVSATGTVGSLDPTDDEGDFWASPVRTAANVGVAGSTLRKRMIELTIDTTVRGREADTFWGDPTFFSAYWDELQSQERSAKTSPVGTGTLDLFFYNKKVDYDAAFSAGTAFLTNKWALRWCYHPDANWTPMPALSPLGQLTVTIYTVMMGELCCVDRALSGKMVWS